MIISSAVDKQTVKDTKRRARVVVLGEFSAGKSTLINLLTGARSLRTQVTATQMPAVWMSYGSGTPRRVDLDGNEHPVDPTDPDSISVADTAYIRTFMKTPALELCDFIDTPGNSDPNIDPIAWERVAELADIAVWCSPATQAWRQSELAAWRDVPERVRARSILLLTRADKLNSDDDRAKVMKRAMREAGEHFTHIHMASLLEFANAREFLHDLIALCNSLDETKGVKADAGEAVAVPETAAVADEPAVQAPEAQAAKPQQPAEQIVAVEAVESDSAETSLLDELELRDDFDADAALDELTAELAQSEELSLDEDTIHADLPEEAEARGYATTLWARLSRGIDADDPDAVAIAFDTFLDRLDAEYDILRDQASMKVAG